MAKALADRASATEQGVRVKTGLYIIKQAIYFDAKELCACIRRIEIMQIWDQILTILRDPIWQFMGVCTTLLIVLVPILISRFKTHINLVVFTKILFSVGIPLLALVSISGVIFEWRLMAILGNLLIIVLFILAWRRQVDQKSSASIKSSDLRKDEETEIDWTSYRKPPKR